MYGKSVNVHVAVHWCLAASHTDRRCLLCPPCNGDLDPKIRRKNAHRALRLEEMEKNMARLKYPSNRLLIATEN